MNHIKTIKIVDPKYQVTLWAKSKYEKPFVNKTEKTKILIILSKRNAAEINKRLYVLLFNFIGVDKFRIKSR